MNYVLLEIEFLSYHRKEVVPQFHCQINLRFSHQLTVIHERGFYGYLCDNNSTEKNGKKSQPTN